MTNSLVKVKENVNPINLSDFTQDFLSRSLLHISESFCCMNHFILYIIYFVFIILLINSHSFFHCISMNCRHIQGTDHNHLDLWSLTNGNITSALLNKAKAKAVC